MKNLYATWNLNKETCINALKSVSINYTHFSEHDASHSQTIIDKIEMLLGDKNKKFYRLQIHGLFFMQHIHMI